MIDNDRIVHMSFDDIDPFVRGVHIVRLKPHLSPVPMLVYDHRITYIHKGEGAIELNNKLYPCKKGDLFYWGPMTQYLVFREPKNTITMINVSFDFTQNYIDEKSIPPSCMVNNYNPKLFTEKIQFSDVKALNAPIHIKEYQDAELALLEMANELKMQRLYSAKRVKGMFLSFLIAFARNIAIDKMQSKKTTNDINQIIEYIHNSYLLPLNNKDIGEMFHFHPNYINKLMVAATGISLHQYVLTIKIQKSIELMNELDLSLTQIAQMLGFSDISHFSKTFKKIMDCAPQVYR